MTTNIYILRLEGGRYYVGKGDNVMNRYQQHLNGGGSAWTRKYKPISVVRIIPNSSPFEEDKQVKEYMAKYGIQNVRGGSYVQIDLEESQILVQGVVVRDIL
jgi:predicted GIY-YIG superfamily endonuclease